MVAKELNFTMKIIKKRGSEIIAISAHNKKKVLGFGEKEMKTGLLN